MPSIPAAPPFCLTRLSALRLCSLATPFCECFAPWQSKRQAGCRGPEPFPAGLHMNSLFDVATLHPPGSLTAVYVRFAPIPQIRTETSATQPPHLPPELNEGIYPLCGSAVSLRCFNGAIALRQSLCCASSFHSVGVAGCATLRAAFQAGYLHCAPIPTLGHPHAVGFW